MDFLAIISLYRGSGILFLTMLYFAINVFVWERAQLNYTPLLQMKSTSPRKSLRIFLSAAVLLSVWGCSLYLCVAGATLGVSLFGIPYWVHGAALFVGLILFLALPFDVLGRSGRFWLLGANFTFGIQVVYVTQFFFVVGVQARSVVWCVARVSRAWAFATCTLRIS
jgi:hypothetical protein